MTPDHIVRILSFMTNTEQRIAKASKLLGKTVARLAKEDPEMAKLVGAALRDAMQALR